MVELSLPSSSETTARPGWTAAGLWLAGLLLIATGCRGSSNESAEASDPDRPRPVKLLVNWYPEAEHGGFYAALVLGIYAEHGLDVDILPGGRAISVPQELITGRVQFGIGNADDVLMARQQGVPLVALMAPLQDSPRCIMVRQDSGIESFEQLTGVTLQIDSSRPYVPFLQSKGLLDSSVTVVPYSGTVTQLVSGPGYAQQAYVFSEPLLAEQAGVPVTNLMMSDIGYNPYACVAMVTEEFLAAEPELVERFVTASREGWRRYLEDPEATNRFILQQNPEGISWNALEYGAQALQSLCLPDGMPAEQIGQMTAQRWLELAEQLAELELIDLERAKPEEAFSLRYLTPHSSSAPL
jgi:NitT/TauT family transport system substrate-binding protein